LINYLSTKAEMNCSNWGQVQIAEPKRRTSKDLFGAVPITFRAFRAKVEKDR